MLVAILYTIVVTAFLIWLLKELTMGMCLNGRSMAGKTVVITGGSDGIGYATAVELAKRGARVIVGCRRFQLANDRIREAVPNADVKSFPLDLGSRKSVEQFAKSVREVCDEIQVLINNAGIGGNAAVNGDEKKKQFKTTDGQHELIMGTNYFGHVVLNHLLLDLVKRSGEGEEFARVILVSSVGAIFGKLDDGLDLEMKNTPHENMAQYCNSKLAQFLYTQKMSEIFDKEGSNVSISCLHPGVVRTPIFEALHGSTKTVFLKLSWLIGKSSFQGSQTTVYLATEDKPRGYFNGKGFADCRDYTSMAVKKAPQTLVDKLWIKTHKVLSISY